jgi:hypothetical protein
MSGQNPGPRRLAEGHLELVTPATRKDADIVVTRADDHVDPFLAFDSEHDPRPSAATTAVAVAAGESVAKSVTPPSLVARAAQSPPAVARVRVVRGGSRIWLLVLGAVLIAVAAAALTYAYLERTRRVDGTQSSGAATPVTPAPPAPGTINVSSQPDGARVFIDGTPRGVTPLSLAMAAGSHVIEVEHQDARRSLPITLDAGATSSQYFDFTTAVPTTGRLEVTSDPPGATVTIDGTARGVTPLVIPAMPPGSHRVVIANRDMTSTRTVTVAAGTTSTLVVPLVRAVATTGFVSVQSPVELDIFLDGTKIGSSAANVRLPVGHHTLDLLNATLEFRTSVGVDVAAGGTASAVVTVPKGKLSINAMPWAEVLLDGRAIGQTPLANLDVPIGTHEVTWRHPQLGERRQTVVVKAQSPARVGMDLNR